MRQRLIGLTIVVVGSTLVQPPPMSSTSTIVMYSMYIYDITWYIIIYNSRTTIVRVLRVPNCQLRYITVIDGVFISPLGVQGIEKNYWTYLFINTIEFEWISKSVRTIEIEHKTIWHIYIYIYIFKLLLVILDYIII